LLRLDADEFELVPWYGEMPPPGVAGSASERSRSECVMGGGGGRFGGATGGRSVSSWSVSYLSRPPSEDDDVCGWRWREGDDDEEGRGGAGRLGWNDDDDAVLENGGRPLEGAYDERAAPPVYESRLLCCGS